MQPTEEFEMNVNGIENINIGELKEIFKLDKLSIKQAIPQMKIFRDKHDLTDKNALKAFGIAKRIFGV